MTVEKIINMAHYHADILQMHVRFPNIHGRNGCLLTHTITLYSEKFVSLSFMAKAGKK